MTGLFGPIGVKSLFRLVGFALNPLDSIIIVPMPVGFFLHNGSGYR